jgi:Ca-activated chloride channel family protein
MKDPALLEYTDQRLFKSSIFPIEPKKSRKVELSYAQIIKYSDGNYRFLLPVAQSGEGQIDEFHLKFRIEMDEAIDNIYSPTHDIDIQRENEREVLVTMEADHLEGNQDFILYFSPADKAINGSLLTFRPRTDRDGYFIFIASPRFGLEEDRYIAKDVIFVVDVSGSMQGEKIKQAKDALLFCVGSLRPSDRFEIISFSSTINEFQGRLKEAGPDEVENARYFIENLSASGGTNMNEALMQALKLTVKSGKRPTSIVFLTDGLPTEGITDIKNIVQNVNDANPNGIRIFNFGVGYDVNTFLLDKLALDTQGSSNYVKPSENIESEVSTFFAKISNPVLTDIGIDFGEANAVEVYPVKLSDLFKGQRLIVAGRYRRAGKTTVILGGLQGEQRQKFSYHFSFDRREKDNDYIAKLWANRKVSHLLNQIRFQGENQELIESIKALGLEYGIVTPYTSYLVTEQERELADIETRMESGEASATSRRMKLIQNAREEKAEQDEETVGGSAFYQALSAAPAEAEKASGKGAVLSSRMTKKMASAEKSYHMILTIRRIGDKTFQLKNGVWSELSLSDKEVPDRVVNFLSEDYFRLINDDPELSKILAVGEQIQFRWKNKIYKIISQ